MKLSRKSSNFGIHVDSSCATESTDLGKKPNKMDREEIIHEGLDKSADEVLAEAKLSEDETRKKLGDDKTEALIRAAAQNILAKMELERAGYDVESLLSARTEEDRESHIEEDVSEVSQEPGTEVSYTESEGTVPSQDDHTEISYAEGTELSHDATEMTYGESSEVSYDNGTEMSYEEGTEMSYDDTEDGTETTNDAGTEIADDQDLEHDAVASESESGRTHNDNDDVFSQTDDRGGSSRNSLNSLDSHPKEAVEEKYRTTEEPLGGNSDESREAQEVEQRQDPSEIEADTKDLLVSISPVSEISAMPPDEELAYTPSKQSIQTRIPFRTPSSVRAIQMSSPTPSVINGNGSPTTLRARSRASQISTETPRPSTSRTATPSQTPIRKKGTPGVFKFKTEHPLVLLHVTVLPLHFPYRSLLDSGEPLPESVQPIRETWRLLQDKLGDLILNRGVLLPHPQDSYEILEEVLLDALELPIRKRGEILKCGHYLSAASTDLASIIDSSESEVSYDDSDGDSMDDSSEKLTNVTKRYWDKNHVCSTCNRTVKIEKSRKNVPKERRFRVKVYASNGLMGAGAWQAAWREMERVDVEIEPFVREEIVAELDNLQNLWSRHLEEMEKRAEEEAQQQFEVEQHQQQTEFEQQQREYEQHHEQYDLEQQVEQHDAQGFIQENLREGSQTLQEESPAPVNESETANIQVEEIPTEESQPSSSPIQEPISQTTTEDHLLQQSNSAQRLREIYGDGPEALEKIQSARASVANSRPQSRQIHGHQSSFGTNGQSTPIPAHALAARLQGVHSTSPSRPRMHSSSPSRSSGYGGLGRNEILPHLAQSYGGEGNLNYTYLGNSSLNSGERDYNYAHNEEFIERGEEFMRERLRRRTEKGRELPRFGEGVDVPTQQFQQRAQSEAGHSRQYSGLREKKALNRDSDSFLELLVEAFKVAMRDRKNVVILILGMLVLFFALKPTDTSAIQPLEMVRNEAGNIGRIENPIIKGVPDSKKYKPQRQQEEPEIYGYDYTVDIEELVAPPPPPQKQEREQEAPKVKQKSKSTNNMKASKSKGGEPPSSSPQIKKRVPKPETEAVSNQVRGEAEAHDVVQRVRKLEVEVDGRVVDEVGLEVNVDEAEIEEASDGNVEEGEEDEEDASIPDQPIPLEEDVASTPSSFGGVSVATEGN